jgi:hypothetical protein
MRQDNDERQFAAPAQLGHGRVVGVADGPVGQGRIAQRHLRGDVAEQRRQRLQAHASVDQPGGVGVPQLVRGDVQRPLIDTANSYGFYLVRSAATCVSAGQHSAQPVRPDSPQLPSAAQASRILAGARDRG